MQRQRWKLLLLASALVACGGKSEREHAGEPENSGALPAVGDVCVTSDERRPTFTGYESTELLVETDALGCESGICVVNGFQGRVGCPYGQESPDGGCLTSDGQPVTVPVAPQLVSRPPSVASRCSCACRGEGPGPFCSCPSGMECANLFGNPLGADPGDWFCVSKETLQKKPASEAVCDAALSNCEARGN